MDLIAIITGSGHAEDNALRLAEQLLLSFEDFPGLANATLSELMAVASIGEAKASRLKAVQEYGHRAFPKPEKKQITLR